MTSLRPDGRQPDQMRQVRITPGYLAHAEGSALIELGQTIVLCAVTTEDRLPPFLRGSAESSRAVLGEMGVRLPRCRMARWCRKTFLSLNLARFVWPPTWPTASWRTRRWRTSASWAITTAFYGERGPAHKYTWAPPVASAVGLSGSHDDSIENIQLPACEPQLNHTE